MADRGQEAEGNGREEAGGQATAEVGIGRALSGSQSGTRTRANIHDGPEPNTLQSKAGYIDQDRSPPVRRKPLATHCRTLRIGFVDVRDLADLHIKVLTAPNAAAERWLAAGDFL
jgi:hypothetical protein